MIRGTKNAAALAGLVVVLLGTSACTDVVGDQVAMAVARLTVQNADAAITALSNDTDCGFASREVLDNIVIEGETMGPGTLTMTAIDCTIDFEVQTTVSEDCYTGVATVAYGRVHFSEATQTVTGTLLGSPESPIAPAGPDAVTLEARVTFEHFSSADADSDVHMIWVQGGMAGTLRPRLAMGEGLPVCSVPTGNKAFWDVTYEPSTVRIVASGVAVDVEVDGANMYGADGIAQPEGHDFVENFIGGEMSVWGQRYTLPVEGDTDGLNPDYDAEEFVRSDECEDGIRVPIRYDCQM